MRVEPPAETTAAPPLSEGRYELHEIIGAGGMATVYRGFDLRLRRACAVKILAPSFWARPKVRARFKAEAEVMAALDHPNIIRVYDTDIEGERAYIVMELVDGGCLTDWLALHGPLHVRTAVEVLIEVLSALEVAHAAGIVHRDIKPHNVLVKSNGEIRVTDFGIARLLETEDDHLTRTGAVMGTWAFMAPEQRSDAKHVDPTADIYSGGATLYTLVTAETPKDLFASDLDPTLFAGVPDAIVPIIRKATRYKKQDRYQTAHEMREALQALLVSLPAPPLDAPGLPTARAVRRRVKHPAEFETLAPADTAYSSLVEPDSTPERDEIEERRVPTAPPLPDRSELVTEIGPELEEPARRGAWIALAAAACALVLFVGWRVWPAAPTVTPAAVEAPRVEAPEATVAPADQPPASEPPLPVPPPPSQPLAPAATAPAPAPTVAATRPKSTHTVAAAPTPVEAQPAVPAIHHTPIQSAAVGQTLSFRADLVSMTDYDQVVLFYRKIDGAYAKKAMTSDSTGFQTTLAVTPDLAGGIEYFIQATSHRADLPLMKSGSGFKPYRIIVN